MPWAPAIALGAIVAPPDAAAATAVLRQLRPPHRLLTILEGESLLNDASALLIYRLAVGAVAADGFSSARWRRRSCSRSPAAWSSARRSGWVTLRVIDRVQDVPTAIILQFVITFGVWILAEQHRALRRADDGVLRDDRGADGARAHARAAAHPVLRGVGDGGVRC